MAALGHKERQQLRNFAERRRRVTHRVPVGCLPFGLTQLVGRNCHFCWLAPMGQHCVGYPPLNAES